MTAAEEGVLLLCCSLGDAQAKPLTMAQFRELGQRVRADVDNARGFEAVTVADLGRLQYSTEDAHRIVSLLERQQILAQYLAEGERRGITPITRVSANYPVKISQHKRLSCPPVLFAMGDLLLLDRPSIGAVGSRQLRPENESFARTVGRLAAEEGYVLVSGGAVGADQAAQEACLAAGGSCIVVLPGKLSEIKPRENVLYLTEDSYDLPFTAARALHRNYLIHMLAEKTVAIQCSYEKGGTWNGCVENLKHGWSQLYVFADGSQGSEALISRGGCGITALTSIDALQPSQISLFE